MPRLWIGNFDFEHELAAPDVWRPSAPLRQLIAERAASCIALADEGDWIWTPEPISEDHWELLVVHGLPRVQDVCDLTTVAEKDLEFVPWGWTRRLRTLSRRTVLPSDESVRMVNSRRWSFAVEQELGVALPGAARVEHLDDFTEIVRRSASHFGESPNDHAWVIKANFGMAARERLLGRGVQLTEPQRRWLQRRITADRAVYFEPWLTRLAEVGLQWTLPSPGHGDPQLEGLTPLRCDPQGEYRGSEFSLDTVIPNEWQQAVEVAMQAAVRLQQQGYFGPLGIDAAIYQDAAKRVHVRPLQDINARYTMGRFSLGFRRLLRPGERGLWWQGRRNESPREWFTRTTREVDLTPARIGDRPPTHGSRLLISGPSA